MSVPVNGRGGRIRNPMPAESGSETLMTAPLDSLPNMRLVPYNRMRRYRLYTGQCDRSRGSRESGRYCDG